MRARIRQRHSPLLAAIFIAAFLTPATALADGEGFAAILEISKFAAVVAAISIAIGIAAGTSRNMSLLVLSIVVGALPFAFGMLAVAVFAEVEWLSAALSFAAAVAVLGIVWGWALLRWNDGRKKPRPVDGMGEPR